MLSNIHEFYFSEIEPQIPQFYFKTSAPHQGLIIDKSGRPLQVYHGTNGDIKSFNPQYLGSAVNNPTARIGFFFTTDPEDAEYWASRRVMNETLLPENASENIIPAYLTIKKAKRISMERYNVLLVRAEAACIKRLKDKWLHAGYDGLMIVGDNCVWFAVFQTSQIHFSLLNPFLI